MTHLKLCKRIYRTSHECKADVEEVKVAQMSFVSQPSLPVRFVGGADWEVLTGQEPEELKMKRS